MFHHKCLNRRIRLLAVAVVFLAMFPGARAEETPSAPMPFPFPIRGVVFEDINKNNVRDEGEPLLSGIPVSDGNDIVFTGGDGAFLLPNTGQKAKTVFVCVPSGFEKTGRFFQILLGLSAEQRFDFPLRRSAPGAGDRFSFAQVTDIHVTSPDDDAPLKMALEQVSSCVPVPEFIMATGDLVGKADRIEWMEAYVRATAECLVPVLNAAGNHDRCEGADRALIYNRFLGPDYYSFNHGRFHFAIRSNTIENPAETAWFENNIRLLSAGKSILVFQHYPPTKEQTEEYARIGVKAVFSGHWHSHKIHRQDGVLCVNTPTLLMGGIDLSPAGFRMVNIDGDHLSLEYRYFDVHEFLHIVSPAPSGSYPTGETLPVRVNACDTRRPPRVLSARVAGTGFEQTFPLSKDAALSWGVEIPGGVLKEGEYTLSILVEPSYSSPPSLVKFRIQGLAEALPPAGERFAFPGGADGDAAASSTLAPPLRLAWIAPTGGTVDVASPIIARGKVFIGVKDRDEDAASGILALDARSGKKVWFVRTGSPVNHSPAFAGGLVIAQEMGGRVHGLDPDTGRSVWTYDCGDSVSRWIYAAPRPVGQDVVVGSPRWLARLDAATGAERWRNTDGVDWISCLCTPSVSEGVIVTGGLWLTIKGKGKGIYAVDAATGITLWAGNEQGLHASPVIRNGIVYYSNIRGGLCAANLSTGKVLWSHSLNPDGNHWTPSSPLVTEDRIIAGSADGRLLALDSENREAQWEFQAGTSLFRMAAYQRDARSLLSSPVLAGGNVWFGAGDGCLYALDVSTGEKKWEYRLGAPVLSSPVIAGRWLYVASCDGCVYGFVSR